MEKAYGYIRVSGLGQVDRDGPVRQREAILGYARANNIDVVRFFVEEGVSGDLIDRPELAEMMVSLENNGNGVKSVIIERLDRLARDVMVQEPIIRDFGNIGVTVMSALEGDVSHSDDPTDDVDLAVILMNGKTFSEKEIETLRKTMFNRQKYHCEWLDEEYA